MSNWYHKLKLSWNSGTPTMIDMDKRMKDPYKDDEASNLVKANPFLGGKERKGYPRDFSLLEDQTDKDTVTDLPQEEILDSTWFGEGAGASNKNEPFSDPEDELTLFNNEIDPTGPHNMPHRSPFEEVSKRPKPAWLRTF